MGRERAGKKEPSELFAPILSQLARHAPGSSRALLAFLEPCLMLDPATPALFPFLKGGPIPRPQAGPKQPHHTRPPLLFSFPCVFPPSSASPGNPPSSKAARWEAESQRRAGLGHPAGAGGVEVGWRCWGMARTRPRTTAEAPPAPLPPEGGGVLAAAAGGWGRGGGFQRSSSQGHICCMCLKQLIKVPERPKK